MNKELPLVKLMDEQELAAYLGCSVSLLRRDRSRGAGIPYIKLGYLVRYRIADVENYVQQNLIPTCK